MQPSAWLDSALLITLLLSALLGLWRGLVYELLSLTSWVAAFVLAQAFASEAAQSLAPDSLPGPLQIAIGFVAVFIAAAFLGALLASLVKRWIASTGLRPADRALGGLFGLLRGSLILLALTLVVHMTALQQHSIWQTSRMAGALTATLHQIQPLLPDVLAHTLPRQ